MRSPETKQKRCEMAYENAKVYLPQGGESLEVASGGSITIAPGGSLRIAAGQLKIIAADGINSTGGAADVTLTGAAVGDRVVAIIGHVKANTGTHGFLVPVIGTEFVATIATADKITQLQAAGDLSANTYLFVLSPA